MFIILCPERNRLIDVSSDAIRVHAALARSLSGSIDNPPGDTFAELLAKCRAAQSLAQLSREALVRHRRDHGC